MSVSLRTRERALGLALVAPALIVLGLVVVYPTLLNGWMSISDASVIKPIAESQFVGTKNFIEVLESRQFWTSLMISVLITVAAVVLEVVIALPVALLLNVPMRGRGLFRSMILLPWAMPTVVAAFIWVWMLHPQYGTLNIVLESLGLIRGGIPWLANAGTAVLSVIVAYVWKGLPWVVLVVLAGLQTVDSSLREAARIDGASSWQEFWHVVLPGLRPVLYIVVVLRIIWTFNWFDFAYLLTGGGPNGATRVLPISVYNSAFVEFEWGRAAALGVLMALILTVLVIVYVRRQLKEGRE